MATIEGQITVNEVDILEVDSDPGAGAGTPAAVGSLALEQDEVSQVGRLYQKIGPLDTDWSEVSSSSASGGNIPIAQARRTTQFTVSGTAWTSITMDVTDVENTPGTIDHLLATNSAQIEVGESGIYRFDYNANIDFASFPNDPTRTRLLLNGVTEIAGTIVESQDANDQIPHSNSIYIELAAGDTVELQAQGASNASTTILEDTTFSCTLLRGTKGDKGDTGDTGDIGPPGLGVYASANTNANGTISFSEGLTPNRVSTGVYDYTFATPPSNTNYAVIAQFYNLSGNATDTNIFVTNKTTSGFRITIGTGDNGGLPDTPIDTDHSVLVFTPGGPTGSTISLEENGTTVTGGPFNTINFEAVNAGVEVTDDGGGTATVTVIKKNNALAVGTNIGSASNAANQNFQIDLTDFGFQVGDTVRIGFAYVRGDLNAGNEFLSVGFGSAGATKTDLGSEGEDDNFFRADGSLIDQIETVVDIGGGTPGLQVYVSPSGDVNFPPGGMPNGWWWQIKFDILVV